MTLPFAALVAVFAAVLETSVFSELPLAGATVDLVLVCAAVATIVLGVEDGLVLGFIGGLLLDMVVASRPLGAVTLAMLLTLGIAFLVSRALSGTRRIAAIGLVLILTAVFHVLFVVVMAVTANASFGIDVTTILIAAVLNAVIAIPVAWLFGAFERRFGTTERAEW
ncbi:MAG: rod shape-determining protein MreD [Candidatus Limnocylindrales bacterium]